MPFRCPRIMLLEISCWLANHSHAEDAFIIGGGMLAVDADLAKNKGLLLTDAAGQSMHGVVVIKPGLTVTDTNMRETLIDDTPRSLVPLDGNQDYTIDALDPYWDAMFLAVDYNGDGAIGKGEYALIGNCGVKSLKLKPNLQEAWSVHTNGSIKTVTTPD